MELKKLHPDNIIPNPDQPRETFNKEKIQELANSIKEFGQLQPIKVRPLNGSGNYQIVYGERRWRAAKLNDMELDCFVKETKPKRQKMEGLIENIHREDLSPY